MVQNATTLYDIEERKGFDIKQYLIDKNEDAPGGMKAAQRRYVESLASYIIFTYLLGIGDRHLENVMLRSDGALFHSACTLSWRRLLLSGQTRAVRGGAAWVVLMHACMALVGTLAVDFGFILGEEPTKAVREGAQFRLCESQIAAMGGPDHANYAYFCDLCVKFFLCLRRHAAVIYTNLVALRLSGCPVALSQLDVQRHFGACVCHG
jgi:phosphatidylinositol 3-kinase